MIPLEAKLRTELRACPQCSMEVKNPLIERCPRCFELLPRIEVDCKGCMHRITCPVQEVVRTGGVDPGKSAK